MEPRQKRPEMKPPSEAMRAWSQALRDEVENWPQVVLKKSFGMTFVYRAATIFAALPATRALYFEDAILLKFQTEPQALAKRFASDPHFARGTMQSGNRKGESRKWRIFLMSGDAHVHLALEWLAEAYKLARAPKAGAAKS